MRSYRRAAEAIEALPQQVADLLNEPKKLLEVPGIGKGMLEHLRRDLPRRHSAPSRRDLAGALPAHRCWSC